jgi:alkylhydroperoxidase/carboxymuconolactone decarboxylase family protein YurZ
MEKGNTEMKLLEEFFPEFTQKPDEIDQLYSEKRMIDKRTYQFVCFVLSVKTRSKPCVLKHFKGALEAEATLPAVVQEIKSKFINNNCIRILTFVKFIFQIRSSNSLSRVFQD